MNPFRKPAVVVDVPDLMRVDLAQQLRLVRQFLTAAQAAHERSHHSDAMSATCEALGIIGVLCDALPGDKR